MKTKKLFLCITALISFTLTYGQTTYVPDDNFEQALIDLGYDSGPLDDYVLTANINTVTTLSVGTKNILDLTGIEGFISLTYLNCIQNNLTTLDISNNINLEVIYCGQNDISSLDTSLNIALEILHVEFNLITSLNVNNNTALLTLDYGHNLISSIDTSNNTLLDRLICRDNNLNILDLSNNVLLETLICYSNHLTEIDLSNNTALTFVRASNNLFSSFNIKNGNNNNITRFEAFNNPNLTCIEVDNEVAATNGTGNYSNWQKDATTNYSEFCLNSFYTYVPDDNFEQYLINIGVDSGALDDYVLTANINTMTSIQLYNKNISDLTGIEDFTALEFLAFGNNNLTTLDISNLSNLNDLRCTHNYLTTLDISNNLNLTILICDNNEISNLNTSLNTELEVIKAGHNLITSLNISNNTALLHLDFSFNQISSIDISNNTLLYLLDGRENTLSTLDISNNLLIESFVLDNNNLTEIDLSNHPAITYVYASSNSLSSLNLKNGNSNRITLLFANGNPDLECIEVDDEVAATNRIGNYASWHKDATTTYSESCISINDLYTYVPDDNFEQALIDLGYDSGPLDDYVLTSNINTVTQLIVISKSIDDLTGIEGFTSLTDLFCGRNNLTELNTSQNLLLERLTCQGNNLLSLDVTNNPLLSRIACSENNISNIDLTYNTQLEDLLIDDNDLTTIDLSNNPLLDFLYLNNNDLTELNTSQNPNLTTLSCNENNISELDVSNNLNLTDLRCYRNNISALDLSNHTALTRLFVNSNSLETLNLKNGNNTSFTSLSASNNPNLRCIQVDDEVAANYGSGSYTLWSKDATAFYSQNCNLAYTYVPDDNFEQALIDFGYDYGSLNNYVLTSSIETVIYLNVSNKNIEDLTGIEDFRDLIALECQNNAIYNLDLSNNLRLRSLLCNSNNLTSLSVKNGRNQILRTFNARENPNLTCIEVDSPNKARLKRGSYKNWVTERTRFLTFNLNCGNSNRTASPTNKTIETQPVLDIKLHPNPTSNYMTVSSIQNIENIEVYDLLGKKILQTKTNKIDMSAFQKGIYIVKIYVGNQMITKKIIKE